MFGGVPFEIVTHVGVGESDFSGTGNPSPTIIGKRIATGTSALVMTVWVVDGACHASVRTGLR